MSDEREGIFGIDLGTTYSVVAYIDDSGKPVIAKDPTTGHDIVPSVVFFENNTNVVVGEVAKESAIATPDQVVSMVKREMGNKEWRKEILGKDYSAPAISALILEALARSAGMDTGRKVKKVVVTVPAYFGMLEKEATRQAGELAGLDVVEVLPEPVAAAFAYGLASSDSGDKTVFVYDLGGGTFDVTLIKMTASNVEVVVVDGNHKLGGRDWDEVLFGHLSEAASRELGDNTLMEDPQFVQDLWKQTEELKKRLSQTETRKVTLRSGGGAASIMVTRAEFEQMTAHLVQETVEITNRALATAENKSPGITQQITDVLLVGGSSLMPIISSTLKKEFGWDSTLADPHLAVARGAALYAAGAVVRQISEGKAEAEAVASGALVDNTMPAVATEGQKAAAVNEVADLAGVEQESLKQLSEKKYSGVLPKAIGVKLIDTDVPNWRELLKSNPDSMSSPFMVQHLVQPQEPLPYMPIEPFIAGTAGPGADTIPIEIWEQAGGTPSKAMSANTQLPVESGQAAIEGLGQYNLPEGAPIHLFFNVSSEGVATLKAVEPSSGKEVTVTAKIALLSDAEMAETKQLISGLVATT